MAISGGSLFQTQHHRLYTKGQDIVLLQSLTPLQRLVCAEPPTVEVTC
jgi:hypothetical protein